jgi:predicted DNA-binding transcriptional regulator AlpA
LLGVSRATMYRYLADNIIKCVVMRGKTFIRRLDIETLFDNATPYEKRICRDRVPITEFYTIEEIKKIYNLKESWIYKMVKEKKIPKVFHRGKNLYSKNRVDKIFADKKPDGSITEWYSVEELQAKFKMTTTAVYSFVYENKIPKKKEGRKVYYSKKHFDVAKGIEKPEEPQYYTSKEAMVKFGLTKDMLYHYVTYHNIPKLKEGRSIKISKKHFDNIFENPVIQ